ncbi:tRNA pseudouridine(55) synthase TruB [soil metagenome]
MNQIPDEGMVILINKPYRWTSFDVVRKLKRLLNVKKVGHAGTLDPLATGLLVVCTGRKTKTIDQIQAAEKEYTGTFYIGASTPSFDLETAVDHQFDISAITHEMVSQATLKFIGTIDQVPPMHSAVKVDGKRAYTLARSGDTTTALKAKQITIKEFELTRIALPEVDFRIVCSKGTYIRSIARDLGLELGVGGHLTALVRTRIGEYKLTDAQDIELMEPIPRTTE